MPSVSGVPWSANSVKNTVIRPRNAGLRVHRGAVVGAGTWPAIVDRESWEAASALLTDPARRTSPGNAPARLLSGLMTCGVCGLPVRSGGARGGVAVYRCSSGAHVKRRVELVDAVVEAYLLALLEREGVGAPTPVAAAPDVRGTADAVRLRLEQLEDKYADGDLTRPVISATGTGSPRNWPNWNAPRHSPDPRAARGSHPGPLGGAAAGTPPRRRGLPGGRDPVARSQPSLQLRFREKWAPLRRVAEPLDGQRLAVGAVRSPRLGEFTLPKRTTYDRRPGRRAS